MNRRKFLENSGAALLSACFFSSCRSVAPHASYSTGKAFVFLESENGFSTARIVDLNTLSYNDIRVPLVSAHSAQRVLSRDDEFIAFDFMGRAVKANVTSGEVTVAPAVNTIFMGHATQTNDGEIIWCTEVRNKNDILVQARRTSDLSLLPGASSVFPGGHHIVKLPDSDILATGWYNMKGSFPSVLFFNYKTRESKVVRLPDHVTVSHLLPVSSSEVVAITHVLSEKKDEKESLNQKPIIKVAYDSMLRTNNSESAGTKKLEFDPSRPAPLVYASLSGDAGTFWVEEHAELFRYGFSIDALPGNPFRFISTHTLSNCVIVWNADRTVHRYITVASPMGAISSADGDSIMILSLGKIRIWSLKKETFTNEITYERPIASFSRYR